MYKMRRLGSLGRPAASPPPPSPNRLRPTFVRRPFFGPQEALGHDSPDSFIVRMTSVELVCAPTLILSAPPLPPSAGAPLLTSEGRHVMDNIESDI